MGGVVAPNGTVMQIVPDGERLVLEARVQRWEIDRVVVDQPARLRLTAFDARTTPEIKGLVAHISPDAEADKRTGLRPTPSRSSSTRPSFHASDPFP